jgi:hypothetical protein
LSQIDRAVRELITIEGRAVDLVFGLYLRNGLSYLNESTQALPAAEGRINDQPQTQVLPEAAAEGCNIFILLEVEDS